MRLLTFLFVFFTYGATAQQVDFATLSTEFLTHIRLGEETEDIENKWKNVSVEELDKSLDTDTKKLVFWINLYNGYIQKILSEKPELYKDRGSFFKAEMIPVIGKKLSFADIEHGFIRRSQFEYFLGYVTNPFAPSYEKILRVEKRDPRIHFALNCGAVDCPPVVIYTVDRYDEQVEMSAQTYLNRITEYEEKKKSARTTSLFSWFRGDFGGKPGIIAMLEKYGAVPKNKVKTVVFKDYNWELSLGNYEDF